MLSTQGELKILTPIGLLGYGIPEADFWRGIDADPHVVILDAGSTDPGPYLLGLGKMIVSRGALERDLELILRGCQQKKIPLLIGSAGGPGIGAHVDEVVEMIDRISTRLGAHFKVASVYSDIDPGIVRARLAEGRISSCASSPPATQADVDTSTHIVAQMGMEPILEVLNAHPDVDIIVAGRAFDPAPYAAYCKWWGIDDPGIFWHLGKIMECGANCATPKGRVILATVRADSFDLEPMNPVQRCTPLSVAAHTLYEKTRPDLLSGPGGVLDLSQARYVALDERRVRVSGSVFKPSDIYCVKLEGAAVAGFRSVFFGSIRDPILIGQIDAFLDTLRARLAATHPAIASGEAQAHFHVYGKNGTMAEFEPPSDYVPREIAVLGEITAPTQELASEICSDARITVLHMPYPNQMATAGNFAIPLNPPEHAIGPVCRFSLYHLMPVNTPIELFPYRLRQVGVLAADAQNPSSTTAAA